MELTRETTKISKWGNSKATRIPSQIINQLNLTDNQTMIIEVKNNAIVMTPKSKKPTNIHELFNGWKDDGKRDHELDWGQAQGDELPW